MAVFIIPKAYRKKYVIKNFVLKRMQGSVSSY